MFTPLNGLALALSLVQGASTAATPSPLAPPAQVRAVRLTAGITLDGRLDEAVWRSEHGVSAFSQREPSEGAGPTERSVVYVAYDDGALYVGARLHDAAPDSIIARLARRDVGVSADRFTVYIDSYRDGRSGFYFGVNAAGTLYDGTLYNDDWDSDQWDGIWEARTASDSAGWTAEFRIPFSQLRFRPEERQTWGINFAREIARKNELNYLVFTPRNGSGFVSRFVPLVGIEGVRPQARFEVMPYVSSRAELLNRPAGDPFHDGSRVAGGAGVDVKYGLGSNLTLDATINPDFGQVEVDPAVVNLSDFETFFPEKRPFFIEGANTFDFGFGGANNYWGFNFGTPDFFYSRRVGRAPQGAVPGADYADVPDGTSILGAAKITGKVGGNWNVGMLHALTAREYARLETGGLQRRAEIEPATYYGVLRGQKEIAQGRYGIGFISTLTARDFDDPVLRDQINGNAVVAGLDGWSFLDESRTWVLTGWAGASRVSGDPARIRALQQGPIHYFQRPDAGHLDVDTAATSMTGFGGRVLLNKQKGDWRVNAAFGFITPGFDLNDAGFQWQADVLNGHVVLSRRFPQPGRVFRFANLHAAAFQSRNFDGDVIWTGLYHTGYLQMLNYYQVQYFVAYNPETVNHRRTRGGPLTLNPHGVSAGFNVNSDGRKSLVLGAGLDIERYAERADDGWSLSGSIEWKPAAGVSLSVEPRYSRSFTAAQYVGTYDDPYATATFGNRYVFANLQQTTLSAPVRLNYIFSPKLSLELYAQPLFATGDYYHYGELAAPRSYDFRRYGTGGSTFDEQNYVADPDGAGPAAPISVGNRDFTFASLRGNAVLRWEYLPGSTIFLVWTQSRADSENIGTFRFGRAFDRLVDARADNIFAVKVTYWWNP